jgi:hypothetical protein
MRRYKMKHICENCKQEFDDPNECYVHEQWCGVPEEDIVHLHTIYIDFSGKVIVVDANTSKPEKYKKSEVKRDALGIHWHDLTPFFASYVYVQEETTYEEAFDDALKVVADKMREYRKQLNTKLRYVKRVLENVQNRNVVDEK